VAVFGKALRSEVEKGTYKNGERDGAWVAYNEDETVDIFAAQKLARECVKKNYKNC